MQLGGIIMIYRVILKVGYNEAWFDFTDLSTAGDFARTCLTNQSLNDDTPKKSYVRIDVIDLTIEGEEED